MEEQRPQYEITAPTVIVTLRGPEARRFVNLFRDAVAAYYGLRNAGGERIVFVDRLGRMSIDDAGLTPYEQEADDELRAAVLGTERR